ncbi:MAG: cupin domain-containing protein [Lachnospiraceae bacterium]|nr:cupin domain-containing protein [Lachnospiraceae bacterium]
MQLFYKFDEAPVHYDLQHLPTGDFEAPVRLSCRGENMSAITCDFPKGFSWKEHAHPHEQLTILFSGSVDYSVDGVVHHMTAGDTLYVPSNAMHTAIALEDCRIMDVFTPVRMDQMAWFDDSIEYVPAFHEKED